MTSDGAGRDTMQAVENVTLDEQIADEQEMLDQIPDTAAYAPIGRAKVASLRELKRIREAKMPKPVAHFVDVNAHNERPAQYEQLAEDFSDIPEAIPLYGPEVLEMLAREREHKATILERHVAIMKDADERYAELLRQSNITLDKLAKVVEGLRECRLELQHCSNQLKSEGWNEGHTVTKALSNSAALLRTIEGAGDTKEKL